MQNVYPALRITDYESTRLLYAVELLSFNKSNKEHISVYEEYVDLEGARI
jgi:hypothetical protein